MRLLFLCEDIDKAGWRQGGGDKGGGDKGTLLCRHLQ